MKTIVFVLLKHDEPLKTLNLVISLTASNQSVCSGRLGSGGTAWNQSAKLEAEAEFFCCLFFKSLLLFSDKSMNPTINVL